MPVGIEPEKQEEKMKKFLVVLLSLGLIAAFGMTASAQDMKVRGSYYLVGVYNDNPTVSPTGYSRAYFFQRLRLQPVFKIAEGLTFTARMDALEKKWGNTNCMRGVGALGDERTSGRSSLGVTGSSVQENIEFERAYVTFMTGIGQFEAGYKAANEWGTAFGDSGTTLPGISFATQLGPVQLAFLYEKVYEADGVTLAAPLPARAGYVDADYDTYALVAVYKAKGMEAGLLYKYYVNKTNRPASSYSFKTNNVSPYMKATFGPVYVEAEASYWFGKAREYETATADIDLKGWNAYLHARTNLGPAYVGAMAGFSSGDDGSDATKSKTHPGGGGSSWNPALILMNDDINTWQGSVQYTNSKTNMNLYNIYAGFNPMPKLNIQAALTYATLNKMLASTPGRSKNLGTEFDVTATYKIYDNLSYMVGAGYLWTGDYFKGAAGTTLIDDDYLVMNKLTLSF
jgi:hypothetical protein